MLGDPMGGPGGGKDSGNEDDSPEIEAAPEGDLEAAAPISKRAKSAKSRRVQDVTHEASDQAPCPDLPLAQRIEAVLICSDRPMPDTRIAAVLGLVREGAAPARVAEAVASIHGAIERLNSEYEATGRAFRIEAVAGGRQVLTNTDLGPLVDRIRQARSSGRLSPAAMEALAIIAYRQPILRADIESIRGVACGEVLRSLMDRRLVRIVGRAEELGRPMLYGTTREFLRVFGLSRLDDLPKTGELAG